MFPTFCDIAVDEGVMGLLIVEDDELLEAVTLIGEWSVDGTNVVCGGCWVV